MSALFEFGDTLPADYAALLWNVFFVQRERGLTLPDHFPALTGSGPGRWFATLRDGGQLCAGLTVLEHRTPEGNTIARVGLVCVPASHRGRGHSQQLLQQALHTLDGRGVTTATLWTGKPGVYQTLGFCIEDTAIVCEVRALPAGPATAFEVHRWPDLCSQRGLPAYAWYAQRLRSPRADALFVFDSIGAALAEWRGDDLAVVELLAACAPQHWRLHALDNDRLPAALADAGAVVRKQSQSLQMWRGPLRAPLRLLDRI